MAVQGCGGIGPIAVVSGVKGPKSLVKSAQIKFPVFVSPSRVISSFKPAHPGPVTELLLGRAMEQRSFLEVGHVKRTVSLYRVLHSDLPRALPCIGPTAGAGSEWLQSLKLSPLPNKLFEV